MKIYPEKMKNEKPAKRGKTAENGFGNSERQTTVTESQISSIFTAQSAVERVRAGDLIANLSIPAMESSEAPLQDGSSAVAIPLPLASASQQPYVSELLSFTLDRLHKVLSLCIFVIVELNSRKCIFFPSFCMFNFIWH